MEKVLSNPAYKGYHVVVVAGKAFKAKTGERAAEILKNVREKYPQETPAITYLPKEDTFLRTSPLLRDIRSFVFF